MRKNSSPISLEFDANTLGPFPLALPAQLERKIARRWKEWEPWVLMQLRRRPDFNPAIPSPQMARIRKWHRNYVLDLIQAGTSMRLVRRHRLADPRSTDDMRSVLVRAATERRKKAWLARRRAISDPHSMLVSDFNNPDIGAASLANSLLRLESSQIAPQRPEKIIASQETQTTIDLIRKRVSQHFHLPELRDPDLNIRSNRSVFVFPRQLAMYLVKWLTGASLQEIGRQFGGRHHTTVLHSINKVEEMHRSEEALNRTIVQLSDGLCL